jgi:hypothetical protein
MGRRRKNDTGMEAMLGEVLGLLPSPIREIAALVVFLVVVYVMFHAANPAFRAFHTPIPWPLNAL